MWQVAYPPGCAIVMPGWPFRKCRCKKYGLVVSNATCRILTKHLFVWCGFLVMDKYLTKTLEFVLVSCFLRKQMLDYIRVRILSEKACTCNLPAGIAELTSDCTPHEFLPSKRQNECRHMLSKYMSEYAHEIYHIKCQTIFQSWCQHILELFLPEHKPD